MSAADQITRFLAALAPGESFGLARELVPEIFPEQPQAPLKQQLEAFCRTHGLFWEVLESGRVRFSRPREGAP